MVFLCTWSDGGGVISPLTYTESPAERRMVIASGLPEIPPTPSLSRSAAVVTTPIGSHLVVGSYHSNTLHVYALPGLALVYTHTLERQASVCGLAADPNGGALVVLLANPSMVQVLEWPLPGMSALETRY